MCNILSYAMRVTYNCFAKRSSSSQSSLQGQKTLSHCIIQRFTQRIYLIQSDSSVHLYVVCCVGSKSVSYRTITVRYSRMFSSFLHSRFCCCRWFIRVLPAQLKVNTHFITFQVLPQLCKILFFLHFHPISCAYFQPPYLFSLSKMFEFTTQAGS